MYGVGQSGSQRRGLKVIFGVMILALVLVGLFYAFYALVLKKDAATPAATEQATATVQVVSAVTETSPAATSTATSKPATPTTAPTLRPTNTLQPTPTLLPPPEVITVGVRVTVNISEGLALNLRDLPTLTGSTVITKLVGGTNVDVTDGPEDVGDLRWWNVDGGDGQAGWVVEAFGGDVWLVPLGWTDQLSSLTPAAPLDTPIATPTTAPVEATPTVSPTLEPAATLTITPTATSVLSPTVTPEGGIPSPTVGGRAQVTTRFEYVNLRATPGLGGESIGQLENGTIVTILEGPEEANDIRWWKVDDGQENIGWAAERVADEVLLVPTQ